MSSPLPRHEVTLPAARVREFLDQFSATTLGEARREWLGQVAALAGQTRPDIAGEVESYLGVAPSNNCVLAGLSITNIGVLYEALLARCDHRGRRERGQYFTPHDVCEFMVEQTGDFPTGTWLDPCCGVGNLAWYLSAVQANPGEFIREKLFLVDMDETALRTAVALLVIGFAAPGDAEAVWELAKRSRCSNFLSRRYRVETDFAIFNPPYGRSRLRPGLRCDVTRELYAQFMEKIAKSCRGFVAITPSSFIHAVKYRPVREIIQGLNRDTQIYSFDNVPDTVFRGFKFGSTNTSATNFVRAAITVVKPRSGRVQLTPILRWKAVSRSELFRCAEEFLLPLHQDCQDRWLRLMPETLKLWQSLEGDSRPLGVLTSNAETRWHLEVATSPRYYISASRRSLRRSSKKVLYFPGPGERDLAYVVLNSSLAYWWWRSVDGGFSVAGSTLQTLPVPRGLSSSVVDELVPLILESEAKSVVTKLNGAKLNENIRHPRHLVQRLNEAVLGADLAGVFDRVYAADLFAESPA